MPISVALVEQARNATPWDLGNQVLYDLCTKHPKHRSPAEVIAKVWLIGRSYAAAIERRRERSDENDDFYVEKVAPAIIGSNIDNWISDVSVHGRISIGSKTSALFAHHQVTKLFSDITGLEKRSLASKYLHFHQPELFFIYDTRAVEALRKLSSPVGRATKKSEESDNEYRKLVEKCLRLQSFIQNEFNVSLTPREIDKLLLFVHAKEA